MIGQVGDYVEILFPNGVEIKPTLLTAGEKLCTAVDVPAAESLARERENNKKKTSSQLNSMGSTILPERGVSCHRK